MANREGLYRYHSPRDRMPAERHTYVPSGTDRISVLEHFRLLYSCNTFTLRSPAIFRLSGSYLSDELGHKRCAADESLLRVWGPEPLGWRTLRGVGYHAGFGMAGSSVLLQRSHADQFVFAGGVRRVQDSGEPDDYGVFILSLLHQRLSGLSFGVRRRLSRILSSVARSKNLIACSSMANS